MSDEESTLLGFSDAESITLDSVKQKFKTRIIGGDIPLLNLCEHGLSTLKSIAKSFGPSVLDKVFRGAVESANSRIKNSELCIDLCISGFKSVTHQLFLKTVEKKFSIKNKGKNYMNVELTIPSVKIPYVKNQIFPDLKIQSNSSLTELNLCLVGESSFIFILFYLKKCIELFMKDLKVPLSECYSCPERSATPDSYDTDSTDSLPKVKKSYKRIICNSSSDDESNQKSTNRGVSECDDGLTATKTCSDNETVRKSSPPPLPEMLSPVYKRRVPFKKSQHEIQCSGCAMLFISSNVWMMVETDYMPIPLDCTSNCLSPDVTDTMADMALSMVTMVSRTDNVNKTTIENFLSNFTRICQQILDKTDVGREGFYIKMLEDLNRIKIADADRVVTVWNEMVYICIGDRGSFEDKLIRSKAARRNLISYLKSTGAIFSVIAVIESWYKMFQKQINLTLILPPPLHFIVNMFEQLVVPEERPVHHSNMSNIARQVLAVIGGGKVEVLELVKKEFRVGCTGRTLNISDDLYLYQNKVESCLILFMFSGKLTVARKVDLEKAVYDEKENKLTTSEWIFHFKDSFAKKAIVSLLEMCKQTLSETRDDDYVGVKVVTEGETPKDNVVQENSFNQEHGRDEGGYHNESDADESFVDRKQCVVKTAFTVDQDNVILYWPPNEKMNVRRKFYPTRIVRDWPKMYGGVCPLNITYNYVTQYDSRKTNANFAKVVGTCVICHAKHTFIVEDNPFEETIEGGKIKYKTTKNMVVDVEAEGYFFVNEGEEPSIKNPVHMKEKARGLHLKGRERELLGDLAAQQGVQATYRQQMAFAREDEIKMGNLTSMRSYPVIKMARQEQEKKQRGGATFYDSARNVLLGQEIDVSPDFSDLGKPSDKIYKLVYYFKHISILVSLSQSPI